MTLVVLEAWHCRDVLDVISDGSLVIGHIVDVTTIVVAMLVVKISGSISTHHTTGGKLRLAEWVLEGSPMASANLMLVGMYE